MTLNRCETPEVNPVALRLRACRLASPNNITSHKFSLGLFDHFRASEQGVDFHGAHFLSYDANGRRISWSTRTNDLI